MRVLSPQEFELLCDYVKEVAINTYKECQEDRHVQDDGSYETVTRNLLRNALVGV